MSNYPNNQTAVAPVAPNAPQKIPFSVAINTKGYQDLINNTLRDKNTANRFIASIMSAVAINPALSDCTPGSVLACGLLGEALGLTPSPQLGYFYMIPFESKEKKNAKGEIVEHACTKAQFILGYKGYIQLAIRSGFYKKINVMAIKKGELIHYSEADEEIVLAMIEDEDEREKAETIGYYAMFEYLNGFRKIVYWTKKKMLSHANRFSKAFSSDAYIQIQAGKVLPDMWKYSSFWYKDFDGMAKKTMLRHMLSKWGLLSVDMQSAFGKDEAVNELSSKGEIVTAVEPPRLDFDEPHQIEAPAPEPVKEEAPKTKKAAAAPTQPTVPNPNAEAPSQSLNFDEI